MLHWYACYTRARTEKKVAERLTGKGYETYLPLIPRTRTWSDRRKVVEWPVFPSYVFCRFDDARYPDVVQTPGITAILGTAGRPTAIPDPELENVRRFVDAVIAHGGEPEPAPAPAFEQGQAVRVVRGPFAGVRGHVREVRGGPRLLVGIRGIGQALEIDIAADALEPGT